MTFKFNRETLNRSARQVTVSAAHVKRPHTVVTVTGTPRVEAPKQSKPQGDEPKSGTTGDTNLSIHEA